MNENQLPIPRTTLTEMVAAWTVATDQIRQAFGLLVEAEKRLKSAFNPDSYLFDLSRTDRTYRDFEHPEELIKELKRDAWKALVDKMGIRSAMSIKRAEELDAQLAGKPRNYNEKVEPLPEISEANILAMMETTMKSIPQMIEEAVKEVFDWLRPSGYSRKEYKTNQKSEWELKDKLILTYCIERGYSHQKPFRVNYHRQKNITALDNVFSMLDGKGIIKTHYGPLTDAINASESGTGQTDYFQFWCYGNGNLHLKFRRMDLVQKLNQVAGGMRLKDDPEARSQREAA